MRQVKSILIVNKDLFRYGRPPASYKKQVEASLRKAHPDVRNVTVTTSELCPPDDLTEQPHMVLEAVGEVD